MLKARKLGKKTPKNLGVQRFLHTFVNIGCSLPGLIKMKKGLYIAGFFALVLVLNACEKCDKPMQHDDPFAGTSVGDRSAEDDKDGSFILGQRGMEDEVIPDPTGTDDSDITDPNEDEDFDGIVDPDEDEDFDKDSDGK
jgi:hypothetical protein